MAKKPTDDFDNIDNAERDWEEPIDDAADFGDAPARRTADHDLHDDSDFVEDDMNDIVDDGDPRAESPLHGDEDEDSYEDHDSHQDGEIEDFNEEDSDYEELQEEAQQQEARKSKVAGLVFYGLIGLLLIGGGVLAYNNVIKKDGSSSQSAATESEAPEESTADKMKIVVPTEGNGPIPVPPTAEDGERTATGWQTNLAEEPAPAQQPAAVQQQQAAAQVQAANAGVTAVPAPVDPQMLQSVSLLNGRISDMANKSAQLTTEIGTLTANIGQVTQLQQQQASQLKALEERPIPSANNTAVVRDPATTNELAELRKQIKALQDKPAPVAATTAAPAAGNSAEVAALRTQIGDLQKQIAAMKSAQDSAVKDMKAQLDQQKRIAAAAPAAAPAPRMESPKAEPKAAAKAPAAKTVTSSAADEQPRSPKTRAPAPAASTWVLRAATPGMAWVSPRPGSAELKRVVVGDQLAGIGTIQSIRQEGGRWIVEGSNGIIR